MHLFREVRDVFRLAERKDVYKRQENMSDVCRRVDTTGQLSDSAREEILKVAKEFLEKYKAENPQNA